MLDQVEGDSKYLTWECRCECGIIVTADSRHLRLGMVACCGGSACREKLPKTDPNIRKTAKSGRRKADITGRRYGRLTALYPTDQTGRGGSVIWRCRCDCGKEVEVTVSELNKGNQKSCGCLKEQYQELLHDRLHLVDGTCVEWLDGRSIRSDNASGHKGIFKKKNGKYSASIGFKKKIYYLGTYEDYEDALEARKDAEELIHRGFLRAYSLWNEKAAAAPAWAKANPFRFDVKKTDGRLTVISSVDYREEAQEA